MTDQTAEIAALLHALHVEGPPYGCEHDTLPESHPVWFAPRCIEEAARLYGAGVRVLLPGQKVMDKCDCGYCRHGIRDGFGHDDGPDETETDPVAAVIQTALDGYCETCEGEVLFAPEDGSPEPCFGSIHSAGAVIAFRLAAAGVTLAPTPPDALRERIGAVLLMGDGDSIPRAHVAALLNDLDDEAFSAALNAHAGLTPAPQPDPASRELREAAEKAAGVLGWCGEIYGHGGCAETAAELRTALAATENPTEKVAPPALTVERLADWLCSTFDWKSHDHEAFLQPDHCEQGLRDATSLLVALAEEPGR